MTGKQNGKLQKNKFRSNRSSLESPQKDDGVSKGPDLSLLRKPIQTSVTGFAQARDVFDTGTEEIKELLSTECDVIYECRVCRNLFRSLANFISHKRIYCRQKFNTSLHAHFINTKYLKDDMMTILQNEQEYQNFLHKKNYTSDIMNVGKESIQKPFTKDITSVIERLTLKQASKNKETESENRSLLKLQPSSQTSQAVFQNYIGEGGKQDLMREQVNEIENIEASQEATLGPDGKIVNEIPVIHISDDEEEEDEETDTTYRVIVCKLCKMRFSTQKTLRFHIKHKHAENRLVYPCPDCDETFVNAWGVYRHLYKVHRKSATYIRKLRESIHNKAFKLQKKPEDDSPCNAEDEAEISEQHRLDLENQEWMDNLEGDCEVPRCGGCGRRFERRAALSSHRQTCQLRIAAQNKITTNMQKRQAAKVAGVMPTSKAEVDKMEVSPPKMVKVETKPIEIQIRKDYNKNGLGSPKRTGTPISEPNGSVCEGDVNRKGEKDDCIINICPNIINKPCVDNQSVGRDYDDANVANVSNESMSDSDGNVSTDMEQDDELNFEDIRRICQEGKETGDDVSLMEVDQETFKCDTSFTCNKCNEELTSLDKLDEHIKNKHENTLFQCKLCHYKSSLKVDCIDHVKTKHKMIGDNDRIGNYVKTLTVPLTRRQSESSDEEIHVILSVESQGSIDESSSQDGAVLQSIATVGQASGGKEELNSSSANCSDVEGDGIKRKRGRPRKGEKVSLDRKLMKEIQMQLPVKGTKMSSISNKKVQKIETSDMEDIDSSPEKLKESNKNTNININNSVNEALSEMEYKSEEKKIKLNTSDTQHSASSMSSTTKRPIRNRVKPLNKDFEYDLSNLLKLEAEAYKESHFPTVIHKQPLKRKPLLQNDSTSSDQSIEAGDLSKEKVRDQTQVKQDKAEKQVKQEKQQLEKHVGALHKVSFKAAEKMKAQMKHVPQIQQKELPQFIAQRRVRTTPTNIHKISSPQEALKKGTPVQKTKAERNPSQQPITPSMIYEKLSLDNSKDNNTYNISKPNTNIESKQEILANMSKILSKSIECISNRINLGDDFPNTSSEQSGDSVFNKKKDLLSSKQFVKKSASSVEKTRNSKLLQSTSTSKDSSDNVEDETSQFVASEKLTSVNILRRKKSITHKEKDMDNPDPNDESSIMLSLTNKFYKKKIPKIDAVSLVDVSDKSESNTSNIDNNKPTPRNDSTSKENVASSPDESDVDNENVGTQTQEIDNNDESSHCLQNE